jgi:hypothetical protein
VGYSAIYTVTKKVFTARVAIILFQEEIDEKRSEVGLNSVWVIEKRDASFFVDSVCQVTYSVVV